MKIACTGSTGRVGRLLVKQGVVPLTFDVTEERSVKAGIDSESPDVVIHLAGISDVDYCEQPEHWDYVRKVNFNGTVNVVRACSDKNIPVIYVSSEHVFSGKTFLGMGGGPYKESHPVNRVGLNNYALTKIACEGLRFPFPVMKIVRTSFLFDWHRLMGGELLPETIGRYNFPTFIYRSYMYLPHFAESLLQYVTSVENKPTVLHISGTKTVSQYAFMQDFVRYFDVKVEIQPRHKELGTGRAARPHRAGLDVSLSHSLGLPQYSYRDGFKAIEKDVVHS